MPDHMHIILQPLEKNGHRQDACATKGEES